jgi:hypothetical protein
MYFKEEIIIHRFTSLLEIFIQQQILILISKANTI